MRTETTLQVGSTVGSVSTIVQVPDGSHCIYALAHGAGANMRHAFMQSLADHLFELGVGTVRYNFPYMEKGGKRPDPPAILEATVRAAIEEAVRVAEGRTVIAGGKSMGGRMTSQALAKKPEERVSGIAFVGFPLHQPGKPATDRAAHLADVRVPMLFLQGTRDTLAQIDLMQAVCAELGPRATLHVIPTADHSFAVLKSSGRNNEDVKQELAATISGWVTSM